MTPKVSSRREPPRDRNTKTEAKAAKIGGGNSIGVVAEGFSTFSNIFHINNMMKME
jgi:hypothetical protein